MRSRLAALLIFIGLATCEVGVGATPSDDTFLNYFSGSWACKIESRQPKGIGVRFSYSGVRHGKEMVYTFDDGSSASEVYNPRLKKYVWLGAENDGSYHASMGPGWTGNRSQWHVVWASWPPPYGAVMVKRTSDTTYSEELELRGVTKGKMTCTKAKL